MNQKLWNSLTTALLVTAIGPLSSQTAQAQAVNKGSSGNISQAQNLANRETTPSPATGGEALAKIYPHIMEGRAAATLHIYNIPVLTFLSSSKNKSLAQAKAIATHIEQLNQKGIDANSITVSPNPEGNCPPSPCTYSFTIQINGENLVTINNHTILPDTTGNLAEDALQATNRLRRLLGNAPPLSEIPGMPRLAHLTEPVLLSFNGWASWYGPGFHGNTSASGEIFNQRELTAAHRELPFGTHVRVTNLDNGMSVIVRINDRGPFVHGRIIDLSAAAAESIGMINSGIAPVRIDVLGTEIPVRISSQP
ncbi:MAG: septal ring lytic transglycosylase RlpA family protein [Oscillatoriaceae bacterium SKW80]|nr:septal ring lytic transglycosylase RlpA family protein [Oscillatoriaceae bacterium SKYG93]MCX8120677.1 septal ring lytic transglycosylase RlpA family protein [Oscillatoriaceae bacterium SKW80]MDW8453785.1 septal ring lytic transglycosylase RlpA family protein [Oscillatoriaceae cyanobacterium SKYGB_i_bin93]HIK27015.1 septal ring lytic transglycosylase RlpA family protein [Oscillatoriaceae cyanobacterium M7585_C2015_266]